MLEFFFKHVWGFSAVGVLILLVAYDLFCVKKIFSIRSELKKILEAPPDFQNLDSAFKGSDLLAPIWKDFRGSLTKNADKIYSATDAAEFFSFQNLTRGMNMTFWQNYGGIFTGLGILGTFAGLTFGLSDIDMTSGDIEILKAGVAKILKGVNTAFVTSLVGIGATLVYSIAHHVLLNKFQSAINQFTDKLDGIFPRRSVEEWLSDSLSESQKQNATLENHLSESQEQTTELKSISEQVATENSWLEKSYSESQNQTTELKSINEQVATENSWLEKSYTESQNQTTELKNIGEQVADAIYKGLDERINDAVDKLCTKLEEKILPHTNRICDAIEKLGAGGSDAVGEIFSERVGSQMDRFSSALDRFSDGIDEKLKTANEISQIMNEQMVNTLKELSETLKQQAQTSSAERDAEYKKFSEALESLIGTLQSVADKIKIQQESTAKDFETLIKNVLDNFNASMSQSMIEVQNKSNESRKQSQAASEQFLTTLAGLGKTLNELAGKIKIQQESTAKNFEALVKNVLDNFNASMSQSMIEVQNKSNESHKQSQAASEQFLTTLSGLGKTLNELAGKIKIQQESTAKDFEALVKNVLDNFNASMSQSMIEVQNKSNESRKQNQAASEQFLTTLSGLSRTLQKVAAEIEKQQVTSIGNFESLIEILLDDLNKFTGQQQKILTDIANGNAAQISQAVKSFREIVDNHNATTQKTFAQVQNQLAQTEKFLQQVNNAGTSLRQAAEPVRQSTIQLSQNLSETSAQMRTLATANQTTRQNLQDLSDKLRTFVNNFNGIADELEHSTDIIKKSLENYNAKINDGLTKNLSDFDKRIADAVGHLQSSVEGLNDALEDFKQIRRRG